MTSAGRPSGGGERGGERDRRDRADRSLVLASHDHGDVASEAQIDDPTRLREPGPRRLHADDTDRALLERPIDVREADAALIADQRHGPALSEPSSAGPILDRDRLFDRAHSEIGELIARAHGVVVAPAAVRVDIQVGVWDSRADRAHRRHVQRRSAPYFDLEGLDPEPLDSPPRPRLPSRPARRTRACALRRHRPRNPPNSVWHGHPRICPTRSHTARSTAPRAT